MRLLGKILLWIGGLTAALYILVCILMYNFQESLIFHPTVLGSAYRYDVAQKFEELNIPVADGKKINALLLKCDSAKGLVFYLHGNAGALDSWADIGKYYAAMGYDVFVMDYRGFGKSEGAIYSEQQFYADAQACYDEMKKRYNEKNIVVIGYSIGTATASMLASTNSPRMLVLQAPYYSLADMMHHLYPFVPDFLLKYKFENFKFISKVKAPVLIFHGDADEVVYYGSSLKLKDHFKSGDRLVTLTGAGHLGMNSNELYLSVLSAALK
jgi:hypothetical protein